jgi:ActR/RegA family two-component response regulator
VRVLLVTQQDDVRRLVEEVVAGSGDELSTATDLAAGLAIAVEHAPHLAVVDVATGGTALAMVHHVLASSPQTAVYVLATAATFEVAAEAISLGAAGLIVAPPTGDALLRVMGDIHARLANEERLHKLTVEVRDAAELADTMTQALLVARAGDMRSLGEALLTLFLVASGARGVAIYGEEDRGGVRRRIAAYGTALELLDRYGDLDLAQIAAARQAEIVGLAATAHMYGCVMLERPNPARAARVHRVIEFATALMPLCVMARSAIAEDATAPRSRALPYQVFEQLLQRDIDTGSDVTVLCAMGGGGEVDTGPLGPALAIAGAAVGVGEAGEIFVLLPKTSHGAARSLLLDLPLAIGMSSAPSDGTRAAELLGLARARARRAGSSNVRELRGCRLEEVIDAFSKAEKKGAQRLEGAAEVVEAVVLHACRHARHVAGAEIILAHGGEAGGVVSAVRAGSGLLPSIRDIDLSDAAVRGTIVVLVLTPRAGWGLVARGAPGGRTAMHTSDPLMLELLRGRLVGSA